MRKAAPGGSRNSQEVVGDSSLQETSCSTGVSWAENSHPAPASSGAPRECQRKKTKNCHCQISLKEVSFSCGLWTGGCLKIKPQIKWVWRPAVKNLLSVFFAPWVTWGLVSPSWSLLEFQQKWQEFFSFFSFFFFYVPDWLSAVFEE